MRTRPLLFVIAVALVAALALVNWQEVMRPTSLNLLWTEVQAPLGAVLLGLLALAVGASLASELALSARHRQRERALAERLQSQRELAERAEASRFVDLRQMLDVHLRDTRQREAGIGTALEQAVQRQQRETRAQLDGLHRALSTRLGEMEARLEARLLAESPRGEWSAAPAAAATRDTGRPAAWAEPCGPTEAGERASASMAADRPPLSALAAQTAPVDQAERNT